MLVEVEVLEIEAKLETARAQIREDSLRAPPEWCPFFEELEERIFDPAFSLGSARRQLGLKGREHTKAFEACLACSPVTYIRRLRVSAARQLLALEGLRRWQAARLTGFRAAESLRAALGREKRSLGAERLGGSNSRSTQLPPRTPRAYAPAALRSLVAGAATDRTEASERQKQLEEAERIEYLPCLERRWAAAFWSRIRRQPLSGLATQVSSAPFETTAFCEFLCEQSQEEGRDDRQRGVVVAELALAALAPLAQNLPEAEHRRWQAKVWACLGNARCLALDYVAAEVAFSTAEAFLVGAGSPADVRAELLCYQSWLRSSQGRLAEALELADEAMALLPERSGQLVVRVLLVRAQAYSNLSQYERALVDLHAVLAHLDLGSEPFLHWMAHQNIASTLWRLDRQAEAEAWLERARALAVRLGRLAPLCHTLWLEGLLADQQGKVDRAVSRLNEACEGLRGIGKWGYFAIASLDLARVETHRGGVAAAVERAAQALPHLEVLKLEKEGLAALALLRQGVAAGGLSTAVLERIRFHAGRAAGVPESPNGPET